MFGTVPGLERALREDSAFATLPELDTRRDTAKGVAQKSFREQLTESNLSPRNA